VTLTIRARLAVIWTLVFGLLFGFVSAISYTTLAAWLENDSDLRLEELTKGLHGYLHENGDRVVVQYDTNDDEEATFIHEATRFYQLYDASNGHLVVQSPGFASLGISLTPAEVETYFGMLQPVNFRTDAGRIRISNSEFFGERRRYLLQVGISLAAMDASLSHYRTLMLWRLPLAMLAAVAVAWWLSGFALRPLARVAAAARVIDVRTLSQRVPLRGVSDELEDVARALNGTLERLEHSVGEMRQFSAALAHELRTPLTAMRGEMELALRTQPASATLRASLASQIEEIDALRSLIDSILTLARAEAGQIPLAFAPIDVTALGASLVDQLHPVAEARQITLRGDWEDAVFVDGDAGWIERLLLNLIDNAVKFTPPGGEVHVRVRRVGKTARIEVQDTGIGMSPDVVAHVFERFYRADPARSSTGSGSGLGLTLVAWIVDRHGGRITVESTPGVGSLFIVTLSAGTGTEGTEGTEERRTEAAEGREGTLRNGGTETNRGRVHSVPN
jgi:heavy metal sensor kinase